MTCSRCHGLMREDHFYDFGGTQGFMWMKGWRCLTCGYAADPIAEANRRLCLVNQAVRAVVGDPTNTMLSVPWRYVVITPPREVAHETHNPGH
jgi:hypothetical protein